MSAEVRPPPLSGSLVGATPEQRRRPAGELLARIPWDGVRSDPTTTRASQFLSQLLG